MKVKLYILFIACLITTVFFSCKQESNSNALQVKMDSLNSQVQTLSATERQEEANKKLVSDFYQEVFGDKNFDAVDKYLGDTYIQHNPALPDGKEALKQGLSVWLKGAPQQKIDIQHLSADGDLVYIHTKAIMGPKTASIIDIFKVANGKLVEHWDVVQEVPEKSANDHPMF
jgi:predicted SnoaL-like aldol condensation-catalyzing enzyme